MNLLASYDINIEAKFDFLYFFLSSISYLQGKNIDEKLLTMRLINSRMAAKRHSTIK